MKQRTEKDGRKLVADFESSRKTQREFAKENGVKVGTLQYWIRRVRKKEKPPKQNRFVGYRFPRPLSEGLLRSTRMACP